ncbi:MAG TPA: ABC transporter permease [Dehalococcoidales bacterium]
MKRALIIALREVKTYLQDKGDLAFSLLLPVATFALIYGAFGGQGLFHGTAYIVNEDTNGVYAKQLIDNIEAEESLDIELLLLADAERKLERSAVNLVLLIPADFSDRLGAGQSVELTFMQRGNGGQEGQIIASIIRGMVSGLNQNLQVQGEQVITTGQSQKQEDPLIDVTEMAVGEKPNTVNEFLPGIITMYVLFAISLGAAVIVEERRIGTLERLLTTRLTVGELFFGKFLASVSRGFVQTFILLALSYAVFQIFTPLSFLTCVLISFIFAMAGSAIGLIIASVARTQDSATWIGVFVTMSMTMLGGTFFTINKGTFLYTLSKMSVNGYANDALKKIISEGGTVGDVWLELVIMVGVFVIGLVVSRLLFKAIPQGK